MALQRLLNNTGEAAVSPVGGARDALRAAGAALSGEAECQGGGPSLVYTPKDIPQGRNRAFSVDPETGETVSWDPDSERPKQVKDHRQSRAERWALKSGANRLLRKGHRTTKCYNFRLPNREREVLRGGEQQRAFYHGMQVCARVWTCPVCASKISERRRVELAAAIASAIAMGLKVYLLTLTVPHGLGDDVTVTLDLMMKAFSKLNQGRAGVGLRELVGLRGTVRALEVTHGENGFHPHFHVLLFLDTTMTPQSVQAAYSPFWQSAAVKVGLPLPSDLRGCRVDGGERAAAYVAKGSGWGLESELVKGHQKRGKKGSRTAWDLLRDYLDGDRAAGALFRVYAESFEGRRQLVWSKGLKKRLAVSDSTDEELANKPDEAPAVLLAQITDGQWKCIRRMRFESAVLDLAESDPEALRVFLSSLSIHGVEANERCIL